MIKKFISFFTSFILITGMLFNINVFANENQGITYEEFKKAQDDGYIGEEITYEELNNFIKSSYQLEKQIENSENFYEIYDSSKDENFSIKRVDMGYSIPYLEPGDILITNGTTVPYLPGHAAIAVSSNAIVHIPGPGQTPEKVSRTLFKNMYIDRFSDWIKIYRPKNPEHGRKAGEWADNTYIYGSGKNAKYTITNDLYSIDETYCSKIVWQAYRFGANARDTFEKTYSSQTGEYIDNYEIRYGLISPYALDSMIKSTYIYKVVN